MHQNKPTAPITYLNKKGVTVPVDADMTDVPFGLKELALLQTLANRSLLNCNCNLDKKVMKSIVDKVNKSIWNLAGEHESE